MPIRATLELYYKRDTIYRLDDVTEHCPHAWLDQSLGCWVVAACYEYDLGAGVFLADAAEPVPSDEDYYNQMPPLAVILPGLKFEMDITDSDGDRGRLVLQHYLPNGTINSLN